MSGTPKSYYIFDTEKQRYKSNVTALLNGLFYAIMAFMCLVVVWNGLGEGWRDPLLYGLGAAALFVAAVRASRMEIRVARNAVVVRGVLSTRTYPFNEIDSVEAEVGGFSTMIVALRLKNGRSRGLSVILNAVNTDGRRTFAERVAEALNRHIQEHRGDAP